MAANYFFNYPLPASGASVLSEAEENGGQSGGGKRQKLQNGSSALAGGVEVQHTAELLGHTDAVTCTVWSSNNRIYSGSMDHSVSTCAPLGIQSQLGM